MGKNTGHQRSSGFGGQQASLQWIPQKARVSLEGNEDKAGKAKTGQNLETCADHN